MDLILVFEIIYLISAVLCAILYPLQLSKELYGAPMTYGYIARGFLYGIVPVLNTGMACYSIAYHAKSVLNKLDRIHVIKEKR